MHQVGAVVAVNGIGGGIGKSALAFQYAQAFARGVSPGGRFLVDTSAASDLRCRSSTWHRIWA